MKTILATLSLLLMTTLAAPAAAECQTVDATGAYACAFVDPEDTSYQSVFVGQPGVGGADVDRYEFTFMGMTQRGTNAFVHTNDASVGVSQFCFVDRETGNCAFQDTMVLAYAEPVGFTMVTLSESGPSRVLCVYSSVEALGCVEIS